jgi:hypothetical protein
MAPCRKQVGVVLSVDKVNPLGKITEARDNELRVHIEYDNAQINYSWTHDGQFVANPFRRHHPGEIVPCIVLDETWWSICGDFPSPTAIGGCVQWDLLGYYRRFVYNVEWGCLQVSLYGEIARRTPASTPGWAKTEMGSESSPRGLLYAAMCEIPIL